MFMQGVFGNSMIRPEKPEPPREAIVWISYPDVLARFGWDDAMFDLARVYGFPASDRQRYLGREPHIRHVPEWRETVVNKWADSIKSLFPTQKRR